MHATLRKNKTCWTQVLPLLPAEGILHPEFGQQWEGRGGANSVASKPQAGLNRLLMASAKSNLSDTNMKLDKNKTGVFYYLLQP